MMIIAIMTRRMTVSFGVNELNHKYSDEERMLMTMTMGLMMFMASNDDEKEDDDDDEKVQDSAFWCQ